MASAEQNIITLGIQLPKGAEAAANYVPWVRTGRTVYVSGQGPIQYGQVVVAGTVGHDVSEAEAYQGARLAALNAVGVLRDCLGSLDKVSRIVKLTVWVKSAPGFQRQHIVANGASDLLGEIFGPRAPHARSAVSANELPFGIALELELIAETHEEVAPYQIEE
jgi:enamine deaminase RidA (YjgF/YER057c/UK114 family)